MRLPFPLDVRIGTDIVATNRMLCPSRPDAARLVRLAQRFLHPREVDDLTRRYPWWRETESRDQAHRRQVAAWVAGRWAAKEAAKKAWGASLISFGELRVEAVAQGDVRIVCDVRPPAHATSHGKVTEQVARLSISHDGDYAMATVLATPLHADIAAELESRTAAAAAKLRGHE